MEMGFILWFNAKLRENETQLTHLNEFLQNVIDSLMSGVAILNQEGNIVAMNRTWEAMSRDIEDEQLPRGLGANFLFFVERIHKDEPEIAREIREGFQKMLSREAEDYERLVSVGTEADPLWLILRASRFEWEGEVRVVLVVVDVTERVLAERTALAEQKRSSQLDGVLSTVRTLQHEINNPLQALLGNVELLQMSHASFDANAMMRLNRMKEASQRIAGVIQRMSILTKVETISSPGGERLRIPDTPPGN
jgi:nitrogen fixation/metabolism regulation signal transduction histidine kinase